MSILTAAPPTLDLAEVFRRAATVITLNGLAKGAFVAPPAIPDAKGRLHARDEHLRPVDMVGAIRIACGQMPTTSGGRLPGLAILFASLRVPGEAPWTDGVPDHIEHLADWTDLTACTAADVANKLIDLAIAAEHVGRRTR